MEREESEDALPHSEQSYREIFNSTSDALLIYDVAGRILDVNDRMCALFACDRATALGLSSHDMSLGAAPYSEREAGELLRRSLQEGPQVYEWRSRRCGGELFWSEVTLRACRISDVTRVIASIRDIGERKRAEEDRLRLLEAEKAARQAAEDVSALKTDLMSLVSHEYANSLTSMKLALAVLLQTEAEDIPADRKETYETIDRAIDYLADATTNFLTLNRIESGHMRINICPTLIRKVVDKVVALLQPFAQGKRMRISIDCPDSPVYARSDSEVLALIISNLMTNAVKFTPPGGSITVRISRLDASRVSIAVEDTGIGMSAAECENILSGSSRAAMARELTRGFGMGMMLTNQLLMKHGSRLEVQSEPGKGSRFSFALRIWEGDDPSRDDDLAA